MIWTQVYDPAGHWWLSTLVAALPIIVLLGLLAGLKVRAHLCAVAGAATAVIVAIVAFKMPAVLAVSSFFYGSAFGLLKIVWIVIAAVFLYDISVATGQFEIMKQSIAAVTPDRRLQLLLVAFCFGAFIEGCAGFGAPVAIAGAFMIGLGFRPFQAAVLNLIANTSPVAWGAIGTPVHTLAAVTSLNESDLSAMIGRILPITALIVPVWLVRTMVSWKETIEVLPAILVVGGSFAATQWFWANHVDSNLVDISAGIVSLVVTLLFLRVWRPQRIWRFADEAAVDPSSARSSIQHYSTRKIARAWMPFAILSIFVLCWGLPSIKTALNQATTPSFKVVMADGKPRPGPPGWDWPYLHGKVSRTAPVVAKPTAEAARFDFNWLTATGTGCFLAAILTGLLLGLGFSRIFGIFGQTLVRLRFAIIAMTCMLGIGYVTRYSGMDAVLGLAFTRTGWLFPFFGTYIGWLGVALTGSDTSSNALFGSLQKITAQQLNLSPILMCATNSAGGVMGKMVDAQSICIATAATNQVGNEGSIFRFLFWHSVALAAIVGLIDAVRLRPTAIHSQRVGFHSLNGMAPESASEMKLEIGHVLFIDIVGYSKLLINEQSEQIQKLKEIVRGTEQFRIAEAEGKLLRLPTGDGGALVFRNSPEAPALCALEIAKDLKAHPELQVRMGIHSGPVNEVTDLNEQANIAGAGINIAQRVMDCGDAGHILLSKRVADDLEQYPRWRSFLHQLGECEVKHGQRVGVVNFSGEGIGNQQVPKKLELLKKRRARARWTAIATALLMLATIVTAFVIVSRKSAKSTLAIPEKSIAVLPFENLSEEKANAYFADGIQDEILTRLSKIADLKVISRTSTQHFKSTPENLPQIAQQLGVANILEGSVQKAADQVRVNVQLINALTDAHLWADTYDRKLTDIFAVESEIAKTIADTLQAKLSSSEKTAMAKKPTASPEAYELYLQGRFFWNKRTGADLRRAIDYFNQAIAKDPNYALAYAALAQSWILLPVYNGGAPKDCAPQAEAAANKALAIDETSSDALTVLASFKALYEFDFAGALKEYERAMQLNPNDATAHQWFANDTLASTGQNARELAEMKRAHELDPLSLIINTNLALAYMHNGRLAEAMAQARETIEMDSNFYYAQCYYGLALELQGKVPEAIAQYEKAVAITDDPIALGMLGHLYGVAGRKDEARKILERLRELRAQRYTAAYPLALIALGLGDRTEALNWLEQGYRERDGNLLGPIRIDPLLTPLHGDPRFEALAEKIVPAREFGQGVAQK